MKTTRATALAFLLLPSLVGCHKKVRVASAPPPPPTPTVNVPPPSHRTQGLPPEPVLPAAEIPLPLPPVRRTAPPRRKPQPVPPAASTVNTPPAPVELGQLTAGDESTNDTLRRQTDDLIKAQSRRLSQASPAVQSAHGKEIDQAKMYLKQAVDAWAKRDLEGARTLATKAKVLLDEFL